MAPHEILGTTSGDGSDVVHLLTLGHSNTRILDRDVRIGLVADDFYLVERVGGIRHELTEEDLCWSRKCRLETKST